MPAGDRLGCNVSGGSVVHVNVAITSAKVDLAGGESFLLQRGEAGLADLRARLPPHHDTDPYPLRLRAGGLDRAVPAGTCCLIVALLVLFLIIGFLGL